MKIVSTVTFLALVSFTTCFAQSPLDKITMEKAFGGYRFYSDSTPLTVNQLVTTMVSDENAY